uniref:Uncharacterized protein n=1 Tax=Rhizophora mucronata TaxID=61149 RepID=A0A2P2JYX9_RHIMU
MRSNCCGNVGGAKKGFLLLVLGIISTSRRLPRFAFLALHLQNCGAYITACLPAFLHLTHAFSDCVSHLILPWMLCSDPIVDFI